MSHVSITNTLLSNLKPTIKPYFPRDGNLKGFCIQSKKGDGFIFLQEKWRSNMCARPCLKMKSFYIIEPTDFM